MDNKSEIGQRLENWILANFKTKTEFCKKSGVSMQTLNNYTNGRSGVGAKFSGVLRGLGCDVEWLISGREESPPITLEIKESDSTKDIVPIRDYNKHQYSPINVFM